MTDERFRGESSKDLRLLDGGKKGDVPVKGGAREADPSNWKLDLAKELGEALASGPGIDYEQLRADLDAVADPSPKDWYAWAARTDRHIRRGALERD